MHRAGRLAALVGLVAGLTALSPTVASASCAGPAPFPQAFESAPAVFTGTVVGLANERRWATVDVDEVWTGGGVPTEVEVRAGPKDPPGPMNVASSVDRYFRLGTRYLFVPYERNGSIFLDNNCTRTTVFRPALERLRPPGAQGLEPSVSPIPTVDESPAAGSGEPSESTSPWPAIAVGVLAVGAAVAAILLRRFR